MMHTDEDRRDHDIAVDRSNPNTHYDRDRCVPDPRYVDGDLEEVLNLLGSKRRRITIRRLGDLVQDDGRVSLDLEELAREVGAIEDDVGPQVVNWRSLRSAKTGLRDNHLPVLDRNSIVDWDPDERVATTTEHTQAYSQLVAALEAAIADADVPLEGGAGPW